ncbi:hypothetical protein C8R45DRAFT_191495 [Mycena sanguinolenta]|nr:hypothetical protein C8R45DRAFT_191495 [Mycena sanguinolenta]
MPKATCCNLGGDPNASPSRASLLDPLPASSCPDIARLLSTNDVPQDADIPLIQQTIFEAEERLRPLDAQIHSLQAALAAQLVERRNELAEHLRGLRAILSPVRRVPPELICEIFDFATAQSRAFNPPWRLGCISATWRQCALTHAALWTYVRVRASAWSCVSLTLPKLEAQLLRCGTALLDVHWTIVNNTGDRPNSDILGLLLPRSNAWRTVSFDIRTVDAGLDWLESVRGKLDGLRRLEVQRKLCTFPDVFTTAPKLHRLVLPSIDIRGYISPSIYRTSISIPWEQITDYQGLSSFAQHLDILRAVPNLLDCVLRVKELDDFVAPTHPAVVLSQLRRLHVDRLGFLFHIVALNLEELCFLRSTSLIPRIFPFVLQASCSLLRLALWYCPLSTELIMTLRELPSLVYLFLHNSHHNEADGLAFFTALGVWAPTTDICPHLTSMVYGYVRSSWENRASRDSFMRMARSRFEGNPSRHSANVFTSLRLLCCDQSSETYLPPDANMNAQVQSLRAEGFNIAFLGEGETADHFLCRKF